MIIQRKIGLIVMLVSTFILFSSYFFTTPDNNGKKWQKLSLIYKTSYKPNLSELVISDGTGFRFDFEEVNGKYKDEYYDNWGLRGQEEGIAQNITIQEVYAVPTFYGFTIRYNYLATICLFFFFSGLYMFVVSQNKNEKS